MGSFPKHAFEEFKKLTKEERAAYVKGKEGLRQTLIDSGIVASLEEEKMGTEWRNPTDINRAFEKLDRLKSYLEICINILEDSWAEDEEDYVFLAACRELVDETSKL